MKKLIIILIPVLISCESIDSPEWTLEMEKWKKDKNACEGYRNQNKSEVINSKNYFMNWPERKIVNIFGRPDRHRLSKRNQKFYVYFLENGKQCDPASDEFGRYIQFRFDAIGYVNEIEIRNRFEVLTD